ncbi:MAG: glutathione S-transferase N-terminal domain-containing protein [Steroidobacteraceae bacterium]
MIDLHTTGTANGFKASIMLEETALPYRVVRYDLVKGEHLKAEYLAINPVGRIPTIVDHDAPDGSISVYGSAAILLYLAEKTGLLMPSAPAARASVYQWLGIVASDLGPAYSGQFAFKVMAPEKLPWAIEFYDKLCARLLATLELQLGRTPFLAGEEYTIADVIAYPAATVSTLRYPGNLDGHPNLKRWAERIGSRPAVQRGMKVGT